MALPLAHSYRSTPQDREKGIHSAIPMDILTPLPTPIHPPPCLLQYLVIGQFLKKHFNTAKQQCEKHLKKKRNGMFCLYRIHQNFPPKVKQAAPTNILVRF